VRKYSHRRKEKEEESQGWRAPAEGSEIVDGYV